MAGTVSNGEAKGLIYRILWTVLGLTISSVIALGSLAIKNMKDHIDINNTHIIKLIEDTRLVREEQIRRSARITSLESRIDALEKHLVRIEGAYRVKYGYELESDVEGRYNVRRKR